MNFANITLRVKSKIVYLLDLQQRLRSWDDEQYLKVLYRIRMGRRISLENPRRFSEKLQWLKIHDRKPIYTTMVDKYDAKDWAAGLIGHDHIIPSLGVWDSFDEINFDELPEQFVLKCTHDSGGLVICDDRSTWDSQTARKKIEASLARNYFYLGREWPYLNVRPRVLAEVYFPTWEPNNVGTKGEPEKPEVDEESTGMRINSSRDGVIDYKFYCFHGEPKFLYVSQGLHDHKTAKMDFLSIDWTPTKFSRPDYRRFTDTPPMPSTLSEMLKFARTLSVGIPFVRVDLFEHRGQVLFSEMTFHPVSGFMLLNPPSADLEIGEMLELSNVKNLE